VNVKELREKLSAYPDDIRVVLNGYEGGVDDAEGLAEVRLKLNAHIEWYYGKHEALSKLYDDDYSSGEPALQVV
jgi:hypothetical protein